MTGPAVPLKDRDTGDVVLAVVWAMFALSSAAVGLWSAAAAQALMAMTWWMQSAWRRVGSVKVQRGRAPKQTRAELVAAYQASLDEEDQARAQEPTS